MLYFPHEEQDAVSGALRRGAVRRRGGAWNIRPVRRHARRQARLGGARPQPSLPQAGGDT